MWISAIKPQNNQSVKTNVCSAFGWILTQNILPVGSKLVVVTTRQIKRQDAPNLTLYVKGRATFQTSDGVMLADRVPGMYSGDRPDSPLGKTIHTATEELEFWCMNYYANGKTLPQLTPLRLPSAGNWTAPPGQRVLICSGSLGAYTPGDTFVGTGQSLTNIDGTYGMLLGSDRVI